MTYNFRLIEKKWQKAWQDVWQTSLDCDQNHQDKPCVYILSMFPYPSGEPHVGHGRNYVLSDVRARYARAKGYTVLHPMGWDSFGLPAENAAIKYKTQPQAWTLSNIQTMKQQMQNMGFSFDWSKEFMTCDPAYYGQQQRLFLALHRQGLVYQKKAYVNWDPVESCVLANEQVIQGRGWRSNALVEKRLLSQWFFRITKYSDDLLLGLDTLSQWPDKVKRMQENWIGRSRGVTFSLKICGSTETFEVFTTRIETLWGASFFALAFDHPLVQTWAESLENIQTFCQTMTQKSTAGFDQDTAEVEGIFTGFFARHPWNASWRIPIYVANYVLSDYGTGAVFGCPAHDRRDYAFSQKYDLPLRPVIQPVGDIENTLPHEGDGIMMNSDFLNGLPLKEARLKAEKKMVDEGTGSSKILYRLRDWCVSRQRYWGTPIPIIHCETCGAVPVPMQDLPVILPTDVTLDTPGNPLDLHPTWKHTSCPQCQAPALRETDTMDTFVDSSWYWAHFAGLRILEDAPDKDTSSSVPSWLPVQEYIGGIEHATLHLIYARFMARALRQCGYTLPKEPFTKLYTQGMVCHKTLKNSDNAWLFPWEAEEKEGQWVEKTTQKPVTLGPIQKMSKSKHNLVSLASVVEHYGADATRLFLLSDTPPCQDMEWTDAGIEGCWAYQRRIMRLFEKYHLIWADATLDEPTTWAREAKKLRQKTHTVIQQGTQYIENFQFNKTIALLRELSNFLEKNTPTQPDTSYQWALREACEVWCQMMAPFMPHMAQELWSSLLQRSQMIHDVPWPQCNAVWVQQETLTLMVQINGKIKHKLEVPFTYTEEDIVEFMQQQPWYAACKEIQRLIILPKRGIISIICQK